MTVQKRLIVLEGVDCSGKSLYAKMLQTELANKGPDSNWIHQHEPTFASDEADRLNFGAMDCWRREYYFMKDRMNHQKILRENNVVLDRYILTGLAYAQVFSPEVIPMMKSIYSNTGEFIHPDATIFIDMDPMNALAINEGRKGTPDYTSKLTIEVLQKLRTEFFTHMQTMKEWDQPVFVIQPFFGDIDKTFSLILDILNAHPII